MVIGSESGSRNHRSLGLRMEIQGSLQEDRIPPLQKKPRHEEGFKASSSEYNPLDEPSPLGLRLRKSPSLLEIIQMKLSQGSSTEDGNQSRGKKDMKSGVASGDKLKASNFPGSLLRIGSWEYKSRYEGDLVVKFYFAKHKLVWEVLDGGLKNKIEIQWSDIVGLRADYPRDGMGTLDVVLARQPIFFRETNPQPRKHTLWQTASDFTGGVASIHRRHYLECPQDLLGKHLEKLVQCDPRLNLLTQQEKISLDSPYFEPAAHLCDDQDDCDNELDLNRESSPSFFSFLEPSSSKNDVDTFAQAAEFFTQESPSPSSARNTLTPEDISGSGFDQLKEFNNWDRIAVPALHSSMSLSDLGTHLDHRISEQGTSLNPNLEWESLQIFDDVNRNLFNGLP